MNPPPSLFPNPFGELHGCDGDGCASGLQTWPLHHVLRRGVHCRLCSSCILLSHRSLYCCRCFFLASSPCNYDDGDMLMAPPAPTIACQVCHEAVAHLPCIYQEPADDVFVCPACNAAQNGRPFTYAPPCGQPLDERGARVLVIAARIALAQLQRHATAARAAAERLAREAWDARERAREALNVAYEHGKMEDDPSWVAPQSPENDLAASEQGSEAEANVEQVLLNAMPPLARLTIGTGGSTSVVPMAMAPAEANDTPPSSPKKSFFDLNENLVDLNENLVDLNENAEESAETGFKGQQVLNSFNMKEVAMAAAEAARANPPTPQTLQLFPSAKASSSIKRSRSRSLQLFDDDDEEM